MLSSGPAARGRRLNPHLLQCCFDRRQDDIQTQVNQINSGKRDDYVSANNRTLVQDVVKDIQKRSFIFRVCPGKNDVVRCGHCGIRCPTSLSHFQRSRGTLRFGVFEVIRANRVHFAIQTNTAATAQCIRSASLPSTAWNIYAESPRTSCDRRVAAIAIPAIAARVVHC